MTTVAVVGGGVAGALLAWRLRRADPTVDVETHVAPASARVDATAASGGLVRAFEPAPDAAAEAAASLAELFGDDELRAAAGYRETGSAYLLPPGADVRAPLAVLADVASLVGSVTVLTGRRARGRLPLRGVPADAVVVAERRAGHVSPHALRAAALSWAASAGATVRTVPVARVGTPLALADGTLAGCDAVVVAAGAWTPALLGSAGLGDGGLRTRQIQYSVHAVRPPGLGAFVDDITGLYGRPHGDGAFLLGLPTDRWDVDPAGAAATRTDAGLATRVAEQASWRLGVPVPAGADGGPGHGVRGAVDRGWDGVANGGVRTVAAVDCYADPPGLRLRAVRDGVFTFTGGSGGAAKTVLAASRAAAAALLDAL